MKGFFLKAKTRSQNEIPFSLEMFDALSSKYEININKKNDVLFDLNYFTLSKIN